MNSQKRNRRFLPGHFNATGLFAVVALLFLLGLLIAGMGTGNPVLFVLAAAHLLLAALFAYRHKYA